MHTDADFLTAIRANPEDDALRLVYADWLEERGDPRGELLRLEMTVDRPAHPELHELARLQELQHTLDRDWVLTVGRANFGRVYFMLPDLSPASKIMHPSWADISRALNHLHRNQSGHIFLRLDSPDGKHYLAFTRKIGGFSFEGNTHVGPRHSDLPIMPGTEKLCADVETVLRVAKYVYYFGEFDPSFPWVCMDWD
jgi:uncharacterized protein (TIGR02996 family)